MRSLGHPRLGPWGSWVRVLQLLEEAGRARGRAALALSLASGNP